MKNQSINLLLEEKINHIIHVYTSTLPPILNQSDFINEINSRKKGYEDEIKAVEKTLDSNLFASFWNTPQVSSLLSDYYLYELIKSTTRRIPKKNLFYDDIVIYCQSVIEQHYPQISSQSSLSGIKLILGILRSMCCQPFPDNIYMEWMFNEQKKFTVPPFFEEHLSEKNLYSSLILKIQFGLSSHFLPDNSTFVDQKSRYTKTLRQAYQNGFVYLLGEYRFNDFYIPPIVLPIDEYADFLRMYTRGQHDYLRDSWKNIFVSSNVIYVVGGAGYGKSLFLSNIINNYSQLKIENPNDYFVIYCDLKSFYNNGGNNGKTVLSFLHESIINQFGIDYISTDLISYYLQRGRCIILLDALDEVKRDVRPELHKKVTSFFAEQNPNNLICITSRDRGFIPHKEIEVFKILPLTEKDIADYLDKMIKLGKFKRGDKDMFMTQASTLIQKKFLNNFLILSLLVNIYKSEKALPENKVDLYKKCFEYIAKKREEEKSKIGYDWKNIYPLMKDSTFIKLAVLAAPNNRDIERTLIEDTLVKQYKTKYIDEATAEVAIKEFLEFCSNRTELFVPATVDDKFKFFHRSFFEYFYARYIHQQHSVEEMYKLMEDFDVDSEVFELTVALVKEDNEEKYQELIEYMFQKVSESIAMPKNYIPFGMLTLAMQVIDDAYFIKKYYYFVSSNPNLMCSKDFLHCNQRFISAWIDKAVSDNPAMQTEVCNIYKGRCLYYVFNKLSSMDQYNKMSLSDFIKRRRVFDMKQGLIVEPLEAINTSNVPFYIILLDKHYGITKLLEESLSLSSTELLELINMNLTIKEVRRVKRGFDRYKKLNDDDKKYLMNFISL